MLEQVATAFANHDYKTAARLLRQLVQEKPNDPWVRLYVGRLHEATGKGDAAEATYRKLLQETMSPKLALQARQGLERLDQAAQARRAEAIAQASAEGDNAGVGFLVLEPFQSDDRKVQIQAFARIMKLDAYTARIHLAHRGWRLYRVGTLGELQVYGQELRNAGIPAFWLPLTQVQQVRVFRVQYVQTDSPKPSVVCLNEADQRGTLTFDWSEVSGQVSGMVPIFEDVVDVGPWNQLKRKESTQDYAQLYDLHLAQRNCLLRFCDRSYQFQQGLDFTPQTDSNNLSQISNRLNWNNLVAFLQSHLPDAPTWSDFQPFAESAIEHLNLVRDIKSHIDLFRKEETQWDPAFHLYSCLAFLKPSDS